MTKIKNTKKGMAKKTLSISLAVAMLATSNVPVWAAEFTDGTDAAFTSEAVVETPVEEVVTDAPVVEDEKAEDASVITNEGDITVDLSVDKTSKLWGTENTPEKDKVTFKINGTVTKNGSALDKWQCRWLDEDGIARKSNSNCDSADDMGFLATKDLAGKKLTLYVYDVDTTGQRLYDINTGITVSVEKRLLTSATFTNENAVKDPVYDGFAQTVTVAPTFDVTDELGGSVAETDYTIATTTTATKAGDEIIATITANSNSAYVGSVDRKIAKIAEREITNDNIKENLVAHVEKGLVYQYTGNTIKIDKAKATLAETLSTNNGDDKKLSGADLSKVITKVEVETPSAVSKNAKVYVNFDATKLDNLNVTGNKYIDAEETVEIKARDLSTAGTKISVKTANGVIPTKTAVNDLVPDYLNIKGAEGVDLSLTEGSDYVISAVDASGKTVTALNEASTYTITVKAASSNCTGEQSFKVETAEKVLTDVVTEKGDNFSYEYTGEEIKPSKDDMGALTVTGKDVNSSEKTETVPKTDYEIVGYNKNINACSYDGSQIKKEATVTVKINAGNFKGSTCVIPFVIKPLEVKEVKAPETISINKGITKPEEYKVPVTVIAKDSTGKRAVTLTDADYTVKYEFEDGTENVPENSDKKNEIHDKIISKVTVTNTNYILGTTDGKTVTKYANETEIVAKKLTDSMVVITPDTYKYTGGKITPTYAVVDGALVLYKKGEVADDKAEYEEVSITDAVNVGTGKVTVKGVNDLYSGTASGTFKITAAKTTDVKVTVKDQDYTGRQVRPRMDQFTISLNGNDVKDQFDIVSYGTNVEAGKGTVVLKPNTKNFTGDNLTVEFNIVKEKISAKLNVYDAKGFNVTSLYAAELNEDGTVVTSDADVAFTFNGNEHKFAKAVLSNVKKVTEDGVPTTATVDDLEIKYVDNITGKKITDGKHNIGYVYAVAKEGTGFAGADTIVTADGTVINGVVAKIPFSIESVKFVSKNVSIKNATYAAGLPVKPEILIQIGGTTLVEGKDYKVTLRELKDNYWNAVNVTPTETTVGNIYGVKIEGINGYEGSLVATYGVDRNNVEDSYADKLTWGVNKKALSDCNVTVKDGVVTVLNGYLPVASTEYTVKNNNNGTYTITAEELSKHYTGSVTVDAEGKAEDEKPDAPMIQSVKVVGNKATVILSGETEGAVGYDYVISTDKDCINNKDYDKVNRNILNTTTDFTYVGQDVYYAYCHAWKRGEDGKKIFSDWSNAYPFVVSAITPSQPAITSVKVKGSTVTVTYTKSSNADGYDVVLGSKVATVAGEKRPVEYGTLVKKNIKGNTVTATFKNVKKGTYYAGLHAFNRTSEDGKKVFSPWSNYKKVTVK